MDEPVVVPSAPITPVPKVPEKKEALQISGFAIALNVVVFLTALMMMLFGMAFSGTEWSWTSMSQLNSKSLGLTILILQVFYTLQSLKTVKLDEIVMLLRFEAYVRDVRPGLVYVPWLFYRLLRAPTAIVEKDLPADPSVIWHGDATKTAEGKVPSGYFPPIRITFAPPADDAPTTIAKSGTGGGTRTIPKDDAYNQRNTAEWEASYGWRINDVHELVKKFGTHVKNGKGPIERVQSQMDDIAIATANSHFSLMTAAEAMTKIMEVADAIKAKLTDESKDWGITVEFFRNKPFSFSHELHTAVMQAAEALPKQRTVIVASVGEKEKRINEGIGAASAEYNLLSARVKVQGELAKVAETPGGKFAMAMQTTADVGKAARAIIVPQNDIYGMVAGVTEMLKSTDPTPRVALTDSVDSAPNGSPQGQPRRPISQRSPRIPNRDQGGKDKK